MAEQNQIPAYDYLKGSEFTSKLKEVLGCRDFLELSKILDVPKSTFSTWNMHDRTSHELMVRLHLAMGIPIADLALSKNDKDRIAHGLTRVTEPAVSYMSRVIGEQSAAIKQMSSNVAIVKSFCLTNGKLLDTGEVPYPVRRINGFGLEKADLIEIETNQSVVLVDKKENDAMNGNYLIAIDGRYSINQVQRLPGKLAIAFDGQTIEVQESDIEVIGKVVLETKLK
ncbi:phage repressor protein CI [Vibrio fluvialis]|uniref:phage repressor protein CI n=1 Tax=Vibrio fluvialis TaxID=676 RepID=UPI001C9DC82E|nr:phage repressor protein CI [Vibrio fluvialis]MBY8075019.1 helix-turn-helix domain-containing protein [Vibrio fluvialis]MCG6368691.1 helix-turn-helix domain-containing protein [Vibrio fluvialis]MCG6377699.1 helix-turn-helix domain-containing protein [Vibrio fluvialis]